MAKSSKSAASNGRSSSHSSNGKKTASLSRKSAPKKPSAQKENKDIKEELMKLFEHALKDMYWVEKALTKAIPKMIKKANSKELQNALKNHLNVTEKQASRLERVFNGIDKTPRAKKCVGMEGILKEGEELMSEFEAPVLDGAIIAAAQKVEHYEISSYSSMIVLARTLDLVREAALLQENLDEEMESDELLTSIAIKSEHEMAIG